jgi:hypothetical protein
MVLFHDDSSNHEIFDHYCTTWWEQFTILLRRGFKEKKHEQFSVHKICHVLALSFSAGLIWWHSNPDHIKDKVLTILD